MITQEQLKEAEQKFPMPKVTTNYKKNFPKGKFVIIEVILFVTGFVLTVAEVARLVNGLVTGLFTLLLLIAGVWHTTAWIAMRICERRRAKWLGITLTEYWNLIQ